jgi:ferredoxin
MAEQPKSVMLCDCEHTMTLAALAKGLDGQPVVNTQLCRAQLDNFRDRLAKGAPFIVACTQEAPLFDEIRAESGIDIDITYTNIRERAGWSAQGSDVAPKIAALLAEAALDIPSAPVVAYKSEGVCLVYGRDETAIDAARQLADHLSVTVLLSKPADIVPPRIIDVPIFRGTVSAAKGYLGAFEIIVDDYAPAAVSSRGALTFEAARNGAVSTCDLILDLSGNAPLFPAAQMRDGYFNPDSGNPAAVQRALFDLSGLTGEFEKPRYIDFDASLCAHSRSNLTGCTRCLDICPASAITPDGDSVAIDPYICGGCGGCNSVCPTGAASYAMPAAAALFERAKTLLTAYRGAGGVRPVLLLHDTDHGEETISMMARFGRGLPANVIPFALNEVTQTGFDFLTGALAYGAAQIVILTPPKARDHLSGLAGQVGMAEALMSGLGYGSGRVLVLTETDPDVIETQLYDLPPLEPAQPSGFIPMGDKRGLIRLAIDHLHKVAPAPVDRIALPPQSAFGAVNIDVAGCTLCLACVGACPTGAMQDNPDSPQLRFQEGACIQCGLCRVTCPENVITLEPRLDFTEASRMALVMKEEEPYECVRCGQPFGTRGTIEKIVEQLANKHSMFQNEETIERIKMCADCRVTSQFESNDNPFAGKDRPIPRTTDDYLRERAEIEEARARFKAGKPIIDDSGES